MVDAHLRRNWDWLNLIIQMENMILVVEKMLLIGIIKEGRMMEDCMLVMMKEGKLMEVFKDSL